MVRGFRPFHPNAAARPKPSEAEAARVYHVVGEDGRPKQRSFTQMVEVNVVALMPSDTYVKVREVGAPVGTEYVVETATLRMIKDPFKDKPTPEPKAPPGGTPPAGGSRGGPPPGKGRPEGRGRPE